MGLIGSLDTGLGSVPTAGDISGGANGTIRNITSPDGSITVTNPTGPTTSIVTANNAVQYVLNAAALAASSGTAGKEGSIAYVSTFGDYFALRTTTLTTDSKTVIASPVAGKKWLRLGVQNRVFQAQPTWVIDPTNTTGLASDENSGVNAANPLLTFAEHARRLVNCILTSAVAVTVLGSQQAGDVPVYNNWTNGGLITFTGTPTVIYTSTVTSYTAMTFGAAAADDAQFVDAAVPGGSFTAAGVLAKGVLVRRTNGTVISCWALKDLGGTTLRVSQPTTDTTFTAQPAFVGGDTYQAQQLPQLLSWRGTESFPGPQFKFFDVRTSDALNYPAARFLFCYISTNHTNTGGIYQNCCWDTGGSVGLGGAPPPGITTFSVGAFKGTGATIYEFKQGNANLEGNITCFQGCQLKVELGFLDPTQLNFYDTTISALNAQTGARVHLLGAIGGKGNTSKLAQAGGGSQIVFTIGTLLVGASTSDPNPYQASGTTSNAPIPLDASMNGVFQTS